jgi:hypothetical protein
MILNSPTISGSLTVTGNIIASGSITLSGSVASASYAASASFVALAQSASNAVSSATASFANAFTVASTLTAQTLVVQTITSSVDFVTGSTRFGSILGNTHVFSGSVTMNPGGLFVSSSGNVGIGTSIPSGSLSIKAEVTNTPSLVFQNVSGGPHSAISNFTSAVQTFTIIGTNIYVNSTGNLARFNTSYAGCGITFDEGILRFSTGTSAITPEAKMVILSSGNVGIGTSSPNGPLDISGPLYGGLYTLSLYDSAAVAANIGGGIYFGGNYTGTTKTGWAGILGRKDNATDGEYGGYMAFYTRTHGVAPAERMRISSAGYAIFYNTIISGMGNDSLIFLSETATTGYQYIKISNTSGGLLMGIEGTTLGNLQGGDIAYSSVITTRNASNLSLGTNQVERLRIAAGGAITIAGSLSKGSGTFRIDHPLESKKDTHQLVHSFVEGPRADLIYRGTTTLVNGTATINIDTSAGMTEGTFVALNRETQFFITNQSGWNNIKGLLQGNILTIEAEDTNSTDTIAWMVVGERQDKHIKDTDWTDSNGKPILEPLKSTE